jgi:NADH-quinone oxidoreductase subunit M
MTELHFPWLELSILIPLVGAAWVSRAREPAFAQSRSIVFCSLTLVCAFGAWRDFQWLHVLKAHDHWDVASYLLGRDLFVVDQLNAPLLPLAALIYLAPRRSRR